MATAESQSGKWSYAVFVEKGTKPHEIPNNPFWYNKIHPGAAPNPFIGPAVERVRAEASPRMKELIRKAKQESGLK